MPAPPKRSRSSSIADPPDKIVLLSSGDDEPTAPTPRGSKAKKTSSAKGTGAAAKGTASRRGQSAAAAAAGGKAGSSKGTTAKSRPAATKQAKLNFQPRAANSLLSLLQATPASQGSKQPASAPASQQQQECSGGGAADGSGPISSQDATTAAAAAVHRGLWIDDYAPSSPDDLAVHPKKVAEVKGWLEGYLHYRSRGTTAWVLLVTGPPGCGKSTTVKVVAQSLGFEVVEWTPPAPTTWAETVYQGPGGVGYQSKLDEFDQFVAHSKLSVLPLARVAQTVGDGVQQQPPQQQQQQQQQQAPAQLQTQQPPRPPGKLLLLDDLPFVGDAERRGRLLASLRTLCLTSRCPVVLVTTESSGGGGGRGGDRGEGGGLGALGGYTKGLHKDAAALLDSLGATTITFNPVTATALSKALLALAAKEGVALTQAAAAAIASAADGDLRNAVQSLQVYAGGAPRAMQTKTTAAAGAKGSRKRPAKGSTAAAAAAGAGDGDERRRVAAQVGRDQRLSIYHALGKLLHNKRDWAPAAAEGSGDEETAAAAAAKKKPRRGKAAAEGVPPRLGAEEIELPAGAAPLELRPELQRPPMRYDPEEILQQSALDAATVAAFLSENYTSFVDAAAVDDLAALAGYLSDAGFLAHYRSATAASSSGTWDEADTASTTLQQAAASSIAARGALFANAHPAAASWQPLRGPSCSLPERAAAENLEQLATAARRSHLALGGTRCGALTGGGPAVAARALPFLRELSRAPSHACLAAALPPRWTYIWNGALTRSDAVSVATGSGGGQPADAAAAALAASLEATGLVDAGATAAAAAATAPGAGGDGGAGEQEEEEEEIEED